MATYLVAMCSRLASIQKIKEVLNQLRNSNSLVVRLDDVKYNFVCLFDYYNVR